MHDLLPRLRKTDFPPLRRKRLETLQVNLGYRCNLACVHCHVAAGPNRTELMDRETLETVLAFLKQQGPSTLDLTGGSPEMHPNFCELVSRARSLGLHVLDRCNPTILEEPGYEWIAEFLAAHQVEVIASLPCYKEENVDRQRGGGVFDASIRGLQRLNLLGYGQAGSDLTLNLVYNPLGPSLPPPQQELEADYRRYLNEGFGIGFDRLFTLTNMPIQRFGSTLLSKGQFEDYMATLHRAYRAENLDYVMCRNLLSVDWRGYVYDCDFNQMLGLPLGGEKGLRHLRDLLEVEFTEHPIRTADHCYGCTAGQGSSCGGALT